MRRLPVGNVIAYERGGSFPGLASLPGVSLIQYGTAGSSGIRIFVDHSPTRMRRTASRHFSPAGAWHFAAGHVPKLELLGRDSGRAPADYTRPSNRVFSISVSNLQLHLPVH
jgi:hypothetical protein